MDARCWPTIATVVLLSMSACGEPEYATPEELQEAAPAEWQPAGITASAGVATFTVPPGFELTTYTDGAAVRSPASQGAQCEIFVLQPRPAASTEAARLQQLLEAAQALFPAETPLADQYGGADPLTHAWRGATGAGWSYEGLINTAADSSIDVLPFLANFGGTAVPVVIIEPRPATPDCVNLLGDFGIDPAVVFHSLQITGFTRASGEPLEQAVIGNWFSSSGGAAASQYVFGANGRYIDAAAVGGTVETSPGEWSDVYASWSGTGRYVVRSDLLALFPTDGEPHSRYVRQFETRSGASGPWEPKLCWVAGANGDPYTHCLYPSEE